MNKRWKSTGLLVAVIGGSIWGACFFGTGVSSQGLPSATGSIQVSEGYSWFHDRVRFMIVREWPSTWSVEQRANEPFVRRTALGGREVLMPTEGWQSVKGDGRVYVFAHDGLRMMTVDMNTHSDQFEMGRCNTVDQIWDFLQQYRVAQ